MTLCIIGLKRAIAAAQVIAIRKPARQHQAIVCRKHADVFVLVPEHNHFLVKIMLQGILHIAVAI